MRLRWGTLAVAVALAATMCAAAGFEGWPSPARCRARPWPRTWRRWQRNWHGP